MPTSAVISDLGRFAIVPEWLLDSGASPQAIRLFAVLACKYADRSTDEAIVTRSRLAQDLHVSSIRTVAAALIELKNVGALIIEHRSTNGDPDASRYVLHFTAPPRAENDPRGRAKDRLHVPEGSDPEGSRTPLVPPRGGVTRSVDRGRTGLRHIGGAVAAVAEAANAG